MRKTISILGSTGSVGMQTLDVVRACGDMRITGLAAARNVDRMVAQIREFKPRIACMWDEDKAKELKVRVADTRTKVVSGMEGLIETATEENAEIVVTAVVGMIGLRPTIAAMEAGKDIALANKETFVTAGHLIMKKAKMINTRILPVDSEHSAIFQSMNGEPARRVQKILLTASGGPFRGKTARELSDMKVEDALKHPNWAMGRKITIDSATMVNKGLEVMEAKWLFGVGLDGIEVVVHPQSIIHSMVEYVDGAVMAQLGMPDMKLPIAYALFYPDRRPMDGKKVDFFELGSLTFEKPDLETFTGLKLAFEAAHRGGSMPTVYNAANEKAVSLFLERKIGFMQIPELIGEAMENHKAVVNPSVEEILCAEREAYEFIERAIS